MKDVIYQIVKIIVKSGLFFYTKKIKVSGLENIPDDGAILFTANHPNGLLDPLLVATSIRRKTHFLVRAAVFKKPTIAYIFDLLGMMPIYRIRDGIGELSKNEQIFNKCESVLNTNGSLLIFPEGSHNRQRTIRPLSKGFTRIIFQTLENNPTLKLSIVPIGITYQNSSFYPCKVALNFGNAINPKQHIAEDSKFEATKNLKKLVEESLYELTVHIPNDEKYQNTLQSLNSANVDYTNVSLTNQTLQSISNIIPQKKQLNFTKPLFYIVVLNSIIPYTFWKLALKKIDEIEFVDTFRFGLNILLFPIFYAIQSLLLTYFTNWKTGIIYFMASLVLVLFYSKLAPTPTE